MQSQDETSFSSKLWLEWVLVTSLSWVLVGLVDRIILLFYSDGVITLALFISGIPVGIAQWYFLRQQIKQAGWWIWATIVGWAITWLIFIGLGPVVGSFIPDINSGDVGPGPTVIYTLLFLAVAIAPIGVGIAQWLVLRQSFYQAGWWVLATVVSFIIGFFVVIVLEVIETVFLGFILFGVINALITGGALGWILSKPQKNPQ